MGVDKLVDTVRVEVPEPPGGTVTCVGERVSVGPGNVGKDAGGKADCPIEIVLTRNHDGSGV